MMTAAISRPRKKHPTATQDRERIPGKAMVPKLVRFWPDELKRIERAASNCNPPVSSSRFIAEAALKAAR